MMVPITASTGEYWRPPTNLRCAPTIEDEVIAPIKKQQSCNKLIKKSVNESIKMFVLVFVKSPVAWVTDRSQKSKHMALRYPAVNAKSPPINPTNNTGRFEGTPASVIC
eukprot:CAMPEP_0114377922 /NCGR_PEP_ID=MMETSP0102-20121206/1309_1 /TAXON_ID=38822 ORGANISM="Pteridomonas danica, Strain PT" /NCGR_SAMPLE_ID=MMETSP0102 /ASSEMBLY_ACC=CAM_ASM_000212 /LENGTH=108 /DNA_ID=CAMNT_0001532639 /DNA_START=439 /DNA_END=762 /DNA_ORIENTATION=-